MLLIKLVKCLYKTLFDQKECGLSVVVLGNIYSDLIYFAL